MSLTQSREISTEARAPRKRSSKPRSQLTSSSALSLAVGLLAVAVTLGPILYLISGGFKSLGQLAADPLGVPDPWMWENYGQILSSGTFWSQVWNSTVVAVGTTAGVVIFGTMAAYPLARYRFRGREVIFGIFTTGLMFPLTVAILPLYLLIRNLGLIGSLWGLIIPQVAFGLSITIIIMRPFLKALPDELEEAAFMDGLSRIGYFFRMVIPLARPGMVTVGVLAFIGSWNAYLLPLLLLTGPQDGMTLPLGTTAFQGQYSSATTLIMAFTSLTMVPALVFFLLMERRIVDGLTGAVKG